MDLLIRDLEPEVAARLEESAALMGHTLNDEVRRILGSASATKEGLGTRVARMFEGIGLRPGEMLERPYRGEARPIDFGQ